MVRLINIKSTTMPYVNVRLIKNQVTSDQKKLIAEGLTNLIVKIMGRDRNYTVITIDELDACQWIIGGKSLLQADLDKRIVSFVNIKVSKGTTNADEMSKMIKATKELMETILGNYDETNYFIIDELNPDGWGFDDIPMTVRNRMGK
jgi:4-oxalocrotonate tautomerase